MTTVLVFDSDYSPAGLSRRLREELARCKLSESEAARRYGVPQQWVNRRMAGHTAWKVSELAHFCHALKLSYTYIVAGGRPLPPEPPSGPQSQSAATVTVLVPRHTEAISPRGAGEPVVDDDALAYVQLSEGLPQGAVTAAGGAGARPKGFEPLTF